MQGGDVRNNTRIQFDLESRCEAWGSGGYVDADALPPRRRAKRAREPLDVLDKLVETQVIPRLLLAHHVAGPIAPAEESASTLARRVGELSELVIAADGSASVAFVSQLREQGLSIEALFQDLLAPTARRLGELWTEDINDFMDVTRGMSQLQLIVHAFGEDLRNEVRAPTADRRALLMPLLGEQHTFGISLVAEHFRREGWRVWGGPPQSHKEMTELASGQWFDVIGLSTSELADPAELAKDITKLRRKSLNPDTTVFVGGKIFSDRPELVTSVGADATALDGRQAVAILRTSLGSC
jgi:methanogenic corrinoid protein MtbC1